MPEDAISGESRIMPAALRVPLRAIV